MTRKRLAVLSLMALLAVLFEGTGRSVQNVTAAEFSVACNVDALKQAIADANSSAGPDVVNLTQGCVYVLTTADNSEAGGDNGLPQITEALTIEGNGATIQRSFAEGTPKFRILRALAVPLTLRGVTIQHGRLDGPDLLVGAGVRTGGDLTVVDSVVIENELVGTGVVADAGGAGTFSSGITSIADSYYGENAAAAVTLGQGGGAFGVEGLVIKRSTFERNVIGGSDALGGAVSTDGNAEITSSTFRLNSSMAAYAAAGAGAHSRQAMTVTSSTLENNTAVGSAFGAFGAGLRADGDLAITTSSILGNDATGGLGSQGGGAYSAGSTTVLRSTVAGNSSLTLDGVSEGGGLYSFGTLTGTNSTISGNSASGSGATVGGGSFSRLSSTLMNMTYTGNSVPGAQGGGVYSNSTMMLTNTLSGSNSGSDCGAIGAITADATDLDTDGSCGSAATVADLKVLPLALNGPGSTQTRALAADSPALNIGTGCPGSDQRGVPRDPGVCDAGAYELVPGFLAYDVECDSDEDALDALAVMNVLAGIATAPQPGGACDADVDNDADVDLSDVIVVRRGVAGL